jgi:hypothetical protein
MPPSSNPQGGEQIELHGIEKQPFEDWANDEITYLERVTIPTHEMAADVLVQEFAVGLDEVNPVPIHMRWVTREAEPELFAGMDLFEDAGWLICEANHPDAVPFWKDAP